MVKNLFCFSRIWMDDSLVANVLDNLGNTEEEKMKEWLYYQIVHFNVFTIIIMITFVTTMSKSNTTKLLKEQSKEIYNDIEELKDEIWRAVGKDKS